ncbi:MAG: TAXI family TRAP transporter solute-binding subunit [Oscillospiraceae bacterium]|nr:TAXI family TRAP transporter solute-binding subunit [Oscillospiraceae bacterium]MBP5743748.1 TAXI family TRAP transporter solute-binding subunit [Oscillospiraceae bacterium]
MKKMIALLLAALMVFALCACGSSAPAATPAPAEAAAPAEEAAPAATSVSANLTMGTGGEAGTYYAFGGVLGSYLGQNTDVSVNVVSSGGSAANITGIVVDGIYDLATVQSDVMTYAYNGTNSFAEGGAMSDFRVLGGLYAETVQIFTCNPDIKSVADLAGRSICVGDVGSGTYFNTVDVLAAYGLTLDDVNAVYQSFADSAESIKDGKIDAAVLTAGAPTTAIVDLTTAKDVYLVSIDDEHMEKLLADCPWYASYTIPAGTYKGVDTDTVTVTVKATLVCRADLDDDVAYTIVSTIYNNADAIAALHAKGAELSLDFATDGIAVPFAAGAAKFFAENGITVDTAA